MQKTRMKRTVLLIDDDEVCRMPAAEMFRRWEWNVVESKDGEEGIALAVRHRPEVIICDLLMPLQNGLQVCQAIRKRPDLRHTRIILVSGADDDGEKANALKAGANDYLVKPLLFEKLKVTLDKVMATAPPKVPPAVDSPPQRRATGMKLKFWGVRGSIPTPGPTTVFYGGNTSCVELRADGEHIILDAGTGIRPLGLALAEEFREDPASITILISHTHWDHIQGFPFFLPAYNPRNRVRILGYEGAPASLAATLAGQMESPYFPIALKQMPGNISIEELREMRFAVGPIRVESCFSNHPGVCVGYRLFTSSGSVVYLPDNEWSSDPEALAKGVIPSTLEGRLVEFIRGADVVIMDSQYDAEEYNLHMGWGHSCIDDVVKLSIKAGVRHLFMFHHDPSHDDRAISALLSHARQLAVSLGGTLRIDAAREGEQVMLQAQMTRP